MKEVFLTAAFMLALLILITIGFWAGLWVAEFMFTYLPMP